MWRRRIDPSLIASLRRLSFSLATRTINQQCRALSTTVGRSSYEAPSYSWAVMQGAIAATLLASAVPAQAEGAEDGQKDWPVFRRVDIARHSKIDDAWVTFQGNVYDMTPFIRNHPGGHEKILLAAGGDLESYWNLYRQHYNSPTPMEVLGRLQIGVLHDDDVEAEEKAKEAAAASQSSAPLDPYENDPSLHSAMRVLSQTPINAEPPGHLLTDSFITPNELFFVRNHHPVPQIDPATFRVELLVQRGDAAERRYGSAGSLSLADLKTQFTPIQVTTTIQCGGNRRLEMTQLEKTNGASWQVSAISTATWTGVSLRELLLQKIFPAHGISEADVWQGKSEFAHVHFVGADGMEASIPLRKALQPDGDVVLAYAMNDSDVPAKHGFPLRAVVPGHVGVRNVKWVQSIRLSREEAYGTWQRGMAYKGFGPSLKSLEGVDVEAIPSLQEQPVTSAITSIVRRPSAPGGAAQDVLHVAGYAYSGGGRGIVRVDVSADGGRSWQDARLTHGSTQPLHRAWAWTFWEADFPVAQGGGAEVVSKATDAAYNVQPDSVRGIWNLRGINNNAWHRVRLPASSEGAQAP